VGGGVGARPPWGAGTGGALGAANRGIAFGNRNPGLAGLGGGRGITPTGFNRGGNLAGRGGFAGQQGLGWRNNFVGNHQGWMGGNRGGGRLTNINNINNVNNAGFFGGRGGMGFGRGFGGLGFPGMGFGRGFGGWGFGRGFGGWGWGFPGWGWGGGWGGWGFPGWGLGGFGLGLGLGWGLGGLGLGWGWGGLGWGLGGLGWGLGGLGLGGWGGGWGGWGPSSWLYGPMLYDWGYSNYYNPYYAVPSMVIEQPATVYDYSQPINPTVAPPAQSVTDQAMTLFDQARGAFRNGDYTTALDLDDQAIKQLPNDATLHEFRGLALFALRRYEDAATPLYAVLTVGPGWDWPTLIGLYPNVETYTAQLRDLESRVEQNPNSAPLRFVLAYHYMSEGYVDAAIGQFREIVRLQPKDTVSAQLLQQLEKAPAAAQPLTPTSATAAATTPATSAPGGALPAPAATVSAPAGPVEGTWVAMPADGTTITLTIAPGGHFTWQVNSQGKTHEFQGDQTHGNALLTLAQTGPGAQPPLVGRMTWQDPDHFTFRLIGGPPDDPGLHFSRKF
jgi:hypothetical protein